MTLDLFNVERIACKVDIKKIKEYNYIKMEVKGTAVYIFKPFIKEKFGEDAEKEWMATLPPEVQTVFMHRILLNKWYPMENICIVPTRKICELFYNGDLRGAWDVGRYSSDWALKGVYKVFVNLAAPANLVKRGKILLEEYYRPCNAVVIENTRNEAILRITKFPTPSKVIEQRIGGWMERSLEICGCNEVNVEITCSLYEGDQYTEFVAVWLK